jgi:hypothetical protein
MRKVKIARIPFADLISPGYSLVDNKRSRFDFKENALIQGFKIGLSVSEFELEVTVFIS